MSEVYALEPPTSGKVIIETNYGNLDVELFTLETPKSCRNFIQLCLNKYYNGCIFFKIFKNFLIQTGDPSNTGNGGESIYKGEFRDEFHSRLRFNHRGIVAMANKGRPNSNGSQFFITLDKCQQLDKKYTIFGKITGPTFFNAINISSLSSDEEGHPNMAIEEKPKIINTQVIINPFTELKPQIINSNNENNEKNNKSNKKKTKKLKIGIETDKPFFDENESENEGKKEEGDEKKNQQYQQDENKEEEEEEEDISKNNNEENESDEVKDESESVSLSSSDDRVLQAKKKLEDDENEGGDNETIKNNNDNIDDLKNDINLLRKKVNRHKKNKDDDEDIKEEIEKEKIGKMNALEKYNYTYLKNNNSFKLSKNEREKKLQKFKDTILTNSTGWFKTKLKFQTDSQKAYGLDFINKEIENKK